MQRHAQRGRSGGNMHTEAPLIDEPREKHSRNELGSGRWSIARPVDFHRLPRQSVAASADATVEIGVAAFTAAERDVEAKEIVMEWTGNSHDSGTVGVSHPSFIKATDARRHFSEVVKQD